MRGTGRSETWLRSASCGNDNCVEIAFVGDGVAIRDSKDPTGPVLRFDRGEWQAFLAGARVGTFDLPRD